MENTNTPKPEQPIPHEAIVAHDIFKELRRAIFWIKVLGWWFRYGRTIWRVFELLFGMAFFAYLLFAVWSPAIIHLQITGTILIGSLAFGFIASTVFKLFFKSAPKKKEAVLSGEEILFSFKDKIAKKHGYADWMDALKNKSGNEMLFMLDEVALEIIKTKEFELQKTSTNRKI